MAPLSLTQSSPYPITAEAIVRDGEGNDLAWINSVTGNVYLKGKLFEDIDTVWIIPDDSTIVRFNGEVMGFITSYEYFDWCLFQTVPAGSLILDGHAVYLGF